MPKQRNCYGLDSDLRMASLAQLHSQGVNPHQVVGARVGLLATLKVEESIRSAIDYER